MGLPFQSDRQVTTVVYDVLKLGDYQVQLLHQLVRFRQLSKFDSFDKRFLESQCQLVRGFEFHHRVAQRDDVLHVSILQLTLCLEERVHLPLWYFTRENALKTRPCRNNRDFGQYREY